MAGYTEDQGIRYLSNEKNNYAELQETVLFSMNQRGQIVRRGTTWKRDRDFIQEAATAKAGPQREDCKGVSASDPCGSWRRNADKRAGGTGQTVRFQGCDHQAAKKELKSEGRVSYFHTGGNSERTWHIRLENGGELLELPAATPVPFHSPSEI